MAKKKSYKTKIGSAVPERSYTEPRSVSIKRAANGYVISTYGEHGESVEVAKTITAANKIAKRILEGW
jgi:hypothetical protein